MSAARGGARSRRGGNAEAHEEESSERWLVTYADMLTLLMVLFVVLYAISQVDSKKFHELSSSLASAFNGGDKSVFDGSEGLQTDSGTDISPQLREVDVDTGVSDDLPAAAGAVATTGTSAASGGTAKAPRATQSGEVSSNAELTKLGQQLTSDLAAAGMPGTATMSVDQRGLTVSVVTSNVVFGGNSAVLLPGGQQVLHVLAPRLAGITNDLEIDGHTNQQQVSTAPWPSGWELSSARASSVVRYLVGAGVAPARLTAVGMSDQRPLYPASDPRSITRNRRVDIVVLSP